MIFAECCYFPMSSAKRGESAWVYPITISCRSLSRPVPRRSWYRELGRWGCAIASLRSPVCASPPLPQVRGRFTREFNIAPLHPLFRLAGCCFCELPSDGSARTLAKLPRIPSRNLFLLGIIRFHNFIFIVTTTINYNISTTKLLSIFTTVIIIINIYVNNNNY